jgi:RNA polymerase sigma-70 factor (ECF subfamily)
MVEAYGNIVLSVALNVVGNRQDAEDICQETFLQVFRRLDRYDRARSFKTWLLTIAYRRSLDMLRKKRRFSEFSARVRFEPAVVGRGGNPRPADP